MAFDLYFAGTVGEDCTNLIRKLNCCQLLSQLNERKSLNKWVQYKREHPECTCKLFVDSGAFSAHTLGKEVNVDEYIEYINSIDDQVTVFAQVDKIPGTFGREHTYEEVCEGAEKSWENYLYMKDKVKSRDKLLPIFHQGEDFKWLRNMLEYTHEDGSHIKYIGISSNNAESIPGKIAWFEKCFKTIKESSNPNVKTHAFGMTIAKILQQFPFTSADSTGWIMTGANGAVRVRDKIIKISEQSNNRDDHYDHLPPAVKDEVLKECEKFGISITELKTDYAKRQLFNIYSLNEWAQNYKYIGNNILKGNLFS